MNTQENIAPLFADERRIKLQRYWDAKITHSQARELLDRVAGKYTWELQEGEMRDAWKAMNDANLELVSAVFALHGFDS